jgi:hypothetical protein
LALMAEDIAQSGEAIQARRAFRAARAHQPSAEELAAHDAFVAGLTNAIWKN